jgi:hypothetical protein
VSNLRIGYLNRADSATLTVTSEAQPALFLQSDDRAYSWRSSDLATQVIQGNWGGTAYPIGMVALARYNLTDAATLQLQLYSDAAYTTQVYDSGTAVAHPAGTFPAEEWSYGHAVRYFTEVAGVKSFKLTIVDAANPAGYMQVSRLFLGPYTQATYNPKYGMQLGAASGSTQTRRPMGALMSDSKGQWRTLSFDMFTMTEADRALWFAIGKYCDKVRSFWLSVYPAVGGTSERDYSMMAKFTASPLGALSNLNLYNFSVKAEEI